jgi:hypothetical protein
MTRQPGISTDFGRLGLLDIACIPPEWIELSGMETFSALGNNMR